MNPYSAFSQQFDTSTSIILDSINDGVFTVDKDWKITFFNRAAEHITGVQRDEAIGKPCCEVFKANICETGCALQKTFATGKPIKNQRIYIISTDGIKKKINISTALLRQPDGQIIGGVETFRDLSQVEELKKELHAQYTFSDIISKNHKMRQLFSIMPEIANSNSTVLIEGESGTGKELFARAIHNLSPRKNKPFIAVNCAALPDTLLESELFGYKAGAFTDAKKDKPGRFAQANKGTLFLDEIGDISQALQVRLLRVLQEKVYEPLGGIEPQHADVRIIAATNRRLHTLVKKNEFRSDLYYRINVMRLHLVPLRERKEDIPLLIDYFIHHFNSITGKSIESVSPSVLSNLMHYDFPGNIRELENIIEHAFVLCSSDIISLQHLPGEFSETHKDATDHIAPHSGQEAFKVMEKQVIIDALKKNNWNRLATAKYLGIHKSTLFRKIKTLQIELPAHDGRHRNDPLSKKT